jgi:hypothetical protein
MQRRAAAPSDCRRGRACRRAELLSESSAARPPPSLFGSWQGCPAALDMSGAAEGAASGPRPSAWAGNGPQPKHGGHATRIEAVQAGGGPPPREHAPAPRARRGSGGAGRTWRGCPCGPGRAPEPGGRPGMEGADREARVRRARGAQVLSGTRPAPCRGAGWAQETLPLAGGAAGGAAARWARRGGPSPARARAARRPSCPTAPAPRRSRPPTARPPGCGGPRASPRPKSRGGGPLKRSLGRGRGCRGRGPGVYQLPRAPRGRTGARRSPSI